MVTRIENGEFTDLLVNHIDRIFKPAYDKTHFIELADMEAILQANLDVYEDFIEDALKRKRDRQRHQVEPEYIE